MVRPRIDVFQKKTQTKIRKRRTTVRDGSILVLSVVLIALFSVIVYTFSVNAGLDVRQSKAALSQVRQRLAAESILELVHANTVDRTWGSRWDRVFALPGFSGELHEGAVQLPNSSQDDPRYGLFNESARLNLNYLALDRLPKEIAVAKLSKTPGLARTTAVAIVDYLRDANNLTQRSHVGILDLSELLVVPGVTEEKLYGRDSNRDGMVDTAEWQKPLRNIGIGLGDSSLGWSGYWTVVAGESTRRPDGTKKIQLNQSDLASLYDQLIEHVSPEEAQFVLAWRLAPAKYTENRSTEDVRSQKMKSMEERESSFKQRLLEQSSGASSTVVNLSSDSTERGGIQLGTSLPIRVPSLVSLCQCSVQIAVKGEDRVLLSPFPNNARDLAFWLERWEEIVTLSEDEVDVTRLNIQYASYEMLVTIEGMTESLAHNIIRTRNQVNGTPSELSTAWLLSQGLVTWRDFRAIAGEITTGGSVVSGIAIGQLERSRTSARIHFVLDHRHRVPQWMYRRYLDPIPAFLHESKSDGQTR